MVMRKRQPLKQFILYRHDHDDCVSRVNNQFVNGYVKHIK
jgi:hypothetical protein